nr:MAG TPA: hypothetical protein [Caudoviricetes sp.]
MNIAKHTYFSSIFWYIISFFYSFYRITTASNIIRIN